MNNKEIIEYILEQVTTVNLRVATKLFEKAKKDKSLSSEVYYQARMDEANNTIQLLNNSIEVLCPKKRK